MIKKIFFLGLVLFSNFVHAQFRGNHTMYLVKGGNKTELVEVTVYSNNAYTQAVSPRKRAILYYVAYYTRNPSSTTEYRSEYTSSGNISCFSPTDCGIVDIPSTELIYEHINSNVNGGLAVHTPRIFDISANQITNTVIPGSPWHTIEYGSFFITYKNKTIYPSGKYRMRVNIKITPTK